MFDYNELADQELAARLQAREGRIRASLGKSVYAIAEAGRELQEAKGETPHGLFEKWVWECFGIPTRSARKLMAVARLLDTYFPEDDQIKELAADRTALYALTEKRLPEEARIEAIRRMGDGLFLTTRVVSAIAEAVEQTAETVELLERATPEVTALALRHQVSPSVIPALTRLQKQHPDEFSDLEASGCIVGPDGDQIPLEDASERDIEEYAYHNRLEDRFQRQAADVDWDNWDVPPAAKTPREGLVAVWSPAEEDFQRIYEQGGRILFVVAAFGDPLVSDGRAKLPVSRMNGTVPPWIPRVLQVVQGQPEGDDL